MVAAADETESSSDNHAEVPRRRTTSNGHEPAVNVEQDSDEDEEEDNDAEDEPRLKYTRLTGNLGAVYRNGDATSSFKVAGDKMVIGTHSGNVHTLSLPTFQSLRLYKPHSASITSISISPFPPTLPTAQSIVANKLIESPETPHRQTPTSGGHGASPRSPRQPLPVPNSPSNQIYIATSSMDGHVCVSSLVDPKDITLRNFARPLQAVALSPMYKSDRSYLSGGLAGELILTTGGQAGTKSNANTSSAAAAAQGWLGAIGLAANSGTDKVLYSGEGTINAIKWSLSGKYVAWANEHGIWIMRTNIKLDSADSEFAWKRIGFIPKPNRRAWEEMATVWKARVEWIDEEGLETDDDLVLGMKDSNQDNDLDATLPQKRSSKHSNGTRKAKPEKLLIGWGDAAWITNVKPGGTGIGKDVGERSVGSVEVQNHLRFEDCIVSGIALYTPSLLVILAYRTTDDDNDPITSTDTPKRGVSRRHNGLSPELRLIDAKTSDEIDTDSLSVSRFETLSAADYHLSTLYVPHPKALAPAQRGAFETLGGGLWDAGVSAARIFSSSASAVSIPSSGDNQKATSSVSSASAGNASASTPIPGKRSPQIHPNVASAGLKVFIQSPYDCVLAVNRDLTDHFNWELGHENYKDAWELLEDHPEIVTTSMQLPSETSPASTPSKTKGSLQEFFADESASQTTISANRVNQNSAVEKEKRRIGDMWVQQLVNSRNWAEAGKVAGRVLGTSSRWEHWVWKFAQANRFDEIAPYIPTKQMHPPLPSLVYEVVLGHYIIHDRIRFKHLLEEWDSELFDINSVIEAIKSKLSAGDVTADSIEGNVQGRDWRILQDGLAKLYLASGRQREALRCYIRLQNADAAMSLVREYHLVEALKDDIPGFILLRVSKEQMESAPLSELEEASSETINLLVDEACRGIVPAHDVVDQLQEKDESFQPFLFFYLRSLWKPESHARTAKSPKERVAAERLAADGKIIAEEFADLMVELFAEYDRALFGKYLKESQSYSLDKAASICERREYIPELVLILSKTGQTKRALYLIIEKLSDVSFAISFAKEQDDQDLWNDLLEYSMDKPHFIRGLLEEVGTAIDPIKLVRQIPEGLEIEGLRDGIGRMVREYEIQWSISEGVAKVLRSEVAQGMDTLRAGQKRGVKFEVIPCDGEADVLSGGMPGAFNKNNGERVDIEPKGVDLTVAANVSTSKDDVTSATPGLQPDTTPTEPEGEAPPGHCTGCHRPFTLPTSQEEEETMPDGTVPLSKDTLVGFACGHVFHLSCLLPKTSASASVAATLQARLAADAEQGSGYWGRSVGAKVAHAHVIKSAIGKGCVVCRAKEEVVEDV